jgi:tetratricopeptide (TPR) repeat protein
MKSTAFCILVSCGLTFGLPAVAQSGNVPNIEDIEMRPVLKGKKNDFPWFNERFGLSWFELESAYSEQEIDAFLARWRSTFPDDPEAWISSANWNWRKSQVEMMFQANPQGGFFVTEETIDDETFGIRRADGGEGDQSSFVTGGISTDKNRYAHALALYVEGLKKFPNRVDLHEIIADFHIHFGNYAELINHLELMPSKLRNTEIPLEQANYQPVQQNKDEIIAGIFHRVIIELMEIGEAKSIETFLETAQLMTRAVPKNPVAWTNLVNAQYFMGNKRGAYSAAQRAHALAPEDEIIVWNLATLSLDLGLRAEAIEHNNWLINNASDPNLLERAQAELELMSVGSK